MNLTASRAYTRQPRVPKMPLGLVQIMEDLTKDVLKHSPTDVYEFCAAHMQKLLEIRDGAKKKMTLEQKIAVAQEKVKQRAEMRRRQYDEYLSQSKLHDSQENNSDKVQEKLQELDLNSGNKNLNAVEEDLSEEESLKVVLKAPVHHEQDLVDSSEIEISHEKVSKKKDTAEEVEKEEQSENLSENICHMSHVENDTGNEQNQHNVEIIESQQTETNSVDSDSKLYLNDEKSYDIVNVENLESQETMEQQSVKEEVKNVTENVTEISPDLLNEVFESKLQSEVQSFSEHGEIMDNNIINHNNTIELGEDFKRESNEINVNTKSIDEEIETEIRSVHELVITEEDATIKISQNVKDNIRQGNIDEIPENLDDNVILESKSSVNASIEETNVVDLTEAINKDVDIHTDEIEAFVIVNEKNQAEGNTENVSRITESNVEDIPPTVENITNTDTLTENKVSVSIDNIEVDSLNENGDDKENKQDILEKDISNSVPNDSNTTDIDSGSTEQENSLDNIRVTNASYTETDTLKDNKNSEQYVHKHEMDLETAAITIQKVFRSFLFKSRASTFDDPAIDETHIIEDYVEKKEDNEIYVPTQSVNTERRALGISRMDTVLQTVNEEKSLSLSTDDSSTLSSAATTIQAYVRGYLVRSKLNSNKTASTSSQLNSDGTTASLEGDLDPNKKTILNIHIAPEAAPYLSGDESTSIDLPFDNSPPSSLNLHPLGYDKNQPRKQLKREDAVQSVSPPSNNSGKLSEDSVKEITMDNVEAASSTTSPSKSVTIETVVENIDEPLNNPRDDSENETVTPTKNSITSSDEMDVVTPLVKAKEASGSNSDSVPKLMHSGEFHDALLPTQVIRNDTTVVRGE